MEEILVPPSLGDLSVLEELDDTEFGIPCVGTLPTLESILNETVDSESEHELENAVQTEPQLQSVDSMVDTIDNVSLASHESRSRHRSGHKQAKFDKHGPILKRGVLKGLSSQLLTANSARVNAGKPTALTLSNVFIVIGTSQGVSLVFEYSQVMKWCLRHFDIEDDVGSVSALAVNGDCSKLLTGYSRGHIALWNLLTGDLLSINTDNHAPLTCVLHIKFTCDPSIAVLSDSGGSVFQLFMRGKKEMDSLCIFSGSRGEVLTLEPLVIPSALRQDMIGFSEICLVALASVTKVIVVSLVPVMRLQFSYPLKADPNTCPLISWQFVVIQISNGMKVVDPVLAFARQNTVHFFQVSYNSPGKVAFTFLKTLTLNYTLQSLHWFNPRTIMMVDTTERMRVVDTRTGEQLEEADVSDIMIVYETAFFKSLATGGNVSRAMAAAGERACYHSICSVTTFSGTNSVTRVFILGENSVAICQLKTWEDRIDWFLKENKYAAAIDLAISFYTDDAKAVLGLPRKKVERQSYVGEKMVHVINKHVAIASMKHFQNSEANEASDYYNDIIPGSIKCALGISDYDNSLIDGIYEKFSENIMAKRIVLGSLFEFIAVGKLRQVNPLIGKELMSYLTEKKRYADIETMVVQLDIFCLDIHQAMTLCREHKLYDGLIYIQNQAFDDHITPLRDLLSIIMVNVLKKKKLDESEIEVGNKLFVYISFCLTGRSFPMGDLPSKKKAKVRADVIHILTERASTEKVCEGMTYPFLRTLLYFDSNEFLNVLSLAFEEPPESEDECAQNQTIVDILLKVMVIGDDFSTTQVGSLFTFLARQVSKNTSPILVSNYLFDQVIDFLTLPNDTSRVEERQQALLELVQCKKLSEQTLDKLLRLSEKANLFRVCEYIYWDKRYFDKLLNCYILDEYRKDQTFLQISQILNSPSIASSEKAAFFATVLQNINTLATISASQSVELLKEYLIDDSELKTILNFLEVDQVALFLLLRCFLGARESDQGTGGGGQIKFKLLNEAETHEKLIGLMCTHEPVAVENFLRESDIYRTDIALGICRQHEVKKGEAYLLEKNGNYNQAFEIRFKLFQSELEQFSRGNDEKPDYSALQQSLESMVQFNQRTSEKMTTAEEREPIWFSLLEEVVKFQQSSSSSPAVKDNNEELEEMTAGIMKGMMRYVSLMSLMQWVLKGSNSGKKDKISDVKDLLMKMLDAYNYEATLFETTNNLLNGDLHQQLWSLTSGAKRAYSSRTLRCSHCKLNFNDQQSSVVVYKCSHTYHDACLGTDHMEDQDRGCPNCSRVKTVLPESLRRRISRSVSTVSNGVAETRRGKPTDDLASTGLGSAQQESLAHIKGLYSATSGIETLRRLATKSTQFPTRINHLVTDNDLTLSPEWRPK